MADMASVVDLLLAGEIERPNMPDSRKITRDLKIRVKNKLKVATAADLIDELPNHGETIHAVSDGKFDYWNMVPVTIDLLGGHIGELWGSTWTMNRNNVSEMMELFDSQKVDSIAIITGTYFKRRESAVYAMILSGLVARKQKFVAFENHTKILLMENGKDYITIEGSANFTANPRFEQFTMSNDRTLYEFHREWMSGVFK
jgi:hypothetical protein